MPDASGLKDAFARVSDRAAAEKRDLGEEKAGLEAERDAKARTKKALAAEVRFVTLAF